VEHSRTNTTVLLVTYSYDQHHPCPARKGGGGGHPTKSAPPDQEDDKASKE
jgi:hypothetical protein